MTAGIATVPIGMGAAAVSMGAAPVAPAIGATSPGTPIGGETGTTGPGSSFSLAAGPVSMTGTFRLLCRNHQNTAMSAMSSTPIAIPIFTSRCIGKSFPKSIPPAPWPHSSVAADTRFYLQVQAERNVTILDNFFKLATADSHPIRIGLAMKIEEYVPTTTPTVMTKANPWITGPPMM